MSVPPAEQSHETEILKNVISRGRQATRFEIGEFVIAVRNASRSEGEHFLLDVLTNPESNTDSKVGRWPDNQGGHWQIARFVAAVGLAELGRPAGVEWLLARANAAHPEHARDLFFAHRNGQHFYARNKRLGENCLKSLADLAEMNSADVNDVETLNNWWGIRAGQFTGGRVHLLFEPGGSLN
ncbi:MAG: hypothetical protein R3C59_08655 [Planctomycetaceae bacterium]